MKLLTIGVGKGAFLAELFAKKGAEINNLKLFKCYTLSNSIEEMKSLKKIPDTNKFFVIWDANHTDYVDVRSPINTLMARHEIYEASLVISDVTDNFSISASLSLAEELKEVMEEPRMNLALIPDLSNPYEVEKVRKGIKLLSKAYDYVFVFEKRRDFETHVLDSFNILSLVGEIDARKRKSGEVVVDTSDLLNSLSDGITIVGRAKAKLRPKIINFFSRKSRSELLGIRTKRMIDLLDRSLKSLSARGDVNTAKKGLIVFAGEPEEITMDGLFACISKMEKINSDIVIRYGDYPIPGVNSISSVILFSGITRFKL